MTDYRPLAFALPAGLFLALWLLALRRARALAAQLKRLEAEKTAAGAATQKLEYRIERFGLLWYPAVEFSPARREILSVVTGRPLCLDCKVPLNAGAKSWACSRCGKAHPESLSELGVTDGIAKEAVRQFKERHEGFWGPKA